MQSVGCISILLHSMVAPCESNENGRFLTQLGLAKLSLEAGWRVNRKCCFSRKDKTISRKKNTGFLYSCLGLAVCKRGAKLSFQALPRKFDFV